MLNYCSQLQLFLDLIFVILCSNPGVIQGETQDPREEQAKNEFDNALGKETTTENFQNNYGNGILLELLKLINSMNDTLTALNTKCPTQDNKFVALNDKIELGLSALNMRLSAQDIQLTAMNAKLDALTTRTNIITEIALPFTKSMSWKQFDFLIETQAKEIKTGDSFNGSTLSSINLPAVPVSYKGWHTLIVFVNYLDEEITDFTMYDKHNLKYNPAPNSIPGGTQQIFTFAHPTNFFGGAHAAFSYVIPSLDCRIAAISQEGANGVGLAFVSKGKDMRFYFYSHQGIEGSSVWESGARVDRNLTVGYKKFYARMFSDYEGIYKSTLRIELIKLP